ncbi:MAG: VOC family protein [Deltaproteobacteria bacterium]|nr:VOC family protein [Deltaproteobacteria bacterium]
MAITGLVHVNINCSDYDRSRAFYELLGFQELWRVPETNTAEVAAAVGMPPYRVKGALMLLQNATAPLVIDLLQWLEPHDPAPPYPHLYHLGVARVALSTDDLDGDMARLAAAGVQFLSAPAQMPPDSGVNARFVCFRDPDGTVLELVQSATPVAS